MSVTPVQELHRECLPPAPRLALCLHLLGGGREQAQCLALGVGVEASNSAPERERLRPLEAEALSHDCRP
jgi:hypothetical protein